MDSNHFLVLSIFNDDARPDCVDTIEIELSDEEYELVKDLNGADYYDLPKSVQAEAENAFYEWNQGRDGGYSLGCVEEIID